MNLWRQLLVVPRHIPTDDIEINALILYRMFGGHAGSFIEEGISTSIPFNPYPEDFGDFRDANIMLINLKSEYKPFIIGMPYGVRIQPTRLRVPYFCFSDWGKLLKNHILLHFAICLTIALQTDWQYTWTNLSSWYTNAADPQKELMALGGHDLWTWIEMNGVEPDYTFYTYDPAQKAYIVPRKAGRWNWNSRWRNEG